MPIYEYHCRGCRRRVSLLILAPSRAPAPSCPKCGSGALTRLMSRFATIKSEEDRLESLADPAKFGDLDEDDPKSVARFMKKMGQELGEDLGEDFGEAVDEATEEASAEGGEAEGQVEDET
ncbi:MAG: zinc ribbon domain-containing protein [Candidatus Rokubacteria bacterium]|nr:zinc ribbon domain-containing protein [Candidatus Rokubacteria bacterium]